MSLTSSTDAYRPSDLAKLEASRLTVEAGLALQQIFQRITEISARYLRIDRVSLWMLGEEGTSLRCVDLFEANKDSHSSGVTIHQASFPKYFASLQKRKTVKADVAKADRYVGELTESYLEPLGITSLLDAPIMVAGKAVGVLCHEHVGPAREWSTEESDFASSMADIIALKIRAAEVQELRTALSYQHSQLQDARKKAALAEAAAYLSQDFHTILTSMIERLETLLSDPQCTVKLAEQAVQIQNIGVRGILKAKEMMGFARPGPLSAKILRPGEFIASILDSLQIGLGSQHKLQFENRAKTTRVFIDPKQLELVLRNLVSNAKEAMADGGIIQITVDVIVESDNEGNPGQFVVISVMDTGLGISPDDQKRIFDPFFTTKAAGQATGIGLAVVDQIASYAGGFVRVKSEPGKGTRMNFYLPRISSL